MGNKSDKPKNVFIDGPISPAFIADSIAHHAVKKNIGAHSIFLGQIRSDETANGVVESIEYEAYTELALDQMHQIRESAFEKYKLTCMHIYHSLGNVMAGEICLFVFTSSAHRRDAMNACDYIVERIKSEVSIWGKEILSDGHQWKVNR